MKRHVVPSLLVAVLALDGCVENDHGRHQALFYAAIAMNAGIVTGTVKGPWWLPEGNPTHPAENVTVRHSDGDSWDISATTAADGSFLLLLPVGTHTISASRDGFESQEFTVAAEAGKIKALTSAGSDHISMKAAPIPKAKWTVMYYIDVNNELMGSYTWHGISGQFYFGLSESNNPSDGAPGLKDTLQDDINVVVYSSQSKVNDNPYFAKPSITVINNKISRTTSKDWDGDSQEAYKAATLKEFIGEVMATYPAEHFMLLVENHGGGIYGICFEGSNHISLKDFGSTLQSLNENKTERIEIVALSACLMGMFEVAYELKDANLDYLVLFETFGDPHGYPVHGQYVDGIEGFFYPSSTHYPFASQTGDADTKDYIKWLTHITTRTARETAQLLCYEQFAQSMQIHVSEHDNNKGNPYCAAAIDVQKFKGVADYFINTFADEAKNNSFMMLGLRTNTQNMYSGTESGYKYVTDYYDLKNFCDRWVEWDNNAVAQELSSELTPSFLFSSNRTTTIQNSGDKALMAVSQYNNIGLNGLSVFMGPFADRPEIKELKIYQDCPQWYDFWNDLLK
jgi:hypothetical protein